MGLIVSFVVLIASVGRLLVMWLLQFVMLFQWFGLFVSGGFVVGLVLLICDC